LVGLELEPLPPSFAQAVMAIADGPHPPAGEISGGRKNST
jgi:hypothetical protein